MITNTTTTTTTNTESNIDLQSLKSSSNDSSSSSSSDSDSSIFTSNNNSNNNNDSSSNEPNQLSKNNIDNIGTEHLIKCFGELFANPLIASAARAALQNDNPTVIDTIEQN